MLTEVGSGGGELDLTNKPGTCITCSLCCQSSASSVSCAANVSRPISDQKVKCLVQVMSPETQHQFLMLEMLNLSKLHKNEWMNESMTRWTDQTSSITGISDIIVSMDLLIGRIKHLKVMTQRKHLSPWRRLIDGCINPVWLIRFHHHNLQSLRVD